jgi:hypothetical protein
MDAQKEMMITELNDITIVPGKSCFLCPGKNTTFHSVLEKILECTGPAELSMASYSVSEPALRVLYRLKSEGQITKLSFLFDRSVRNNKLDLLAFAAQFADEIFLDSSHIKLALINNDQHNVVVITTANITENERWEYYLIAATSELVSEAVNMLSYLLNFSEKFTWNGSGTTKTN